MNSRGPAVLLPVRVFPVFFPFLFLDFPIREAIIEDRKSGTVTV